MRPPLPEEPVYPEQTLQAITSYLSSAGVRLGHAVAWRFVYADRHITVRFDGERWSVAQDDADSPDVVIATTPRGWIAIMMQPPHERTPLLRALRLQGERDRINEFVEIFTGRTPATTA